MKKQDTTAFANALVTRFEAKLTERAESMPQSQRDDLTLASRLASSTLSERSFISKS